jgi:hypothetical protein
MANAKITSIADALRAKRHTPEREGPIRASASVLRHPEPSEKRERRPGEPRVEGGVSMSSPEDVAVYAARLGYRVAEEQMRKGRNVARRMRKASLDSGSGDVGEMISYGLRFYRQASELLVEVAETVGGGSRLWTRFKGEDAGKSASGKPESGKPASGKSAASSTYTEQTLAKMADLVADRLGEKLVDLVGADMLPEKSTSTGSDAQAKAGGDTPAQPRCVLRTSGVAADVCAEGALGLTPPFGKALVCGGLLGPSKEPLECKVVIGQDNKVTATVKCVGATPGRYYGVVHDQASGSPVGTVYVDITKVDG